ncbi:T9SS type A sorting domain-containing protein [bacterium]|nr:T9SS type A sorting domain-containing protein [bacterium]
MKNMQRILILLMLVLSISVQGADMVVSGGGTLLVNGPYTNMGTHASLSNGVDYYQKGSIYLYRYYHAGADEYFWQLSNSLGAYTFENGYYITIGSNDTPNGYTFDDAGHLGTAPMPSVTGTTGALNMVASGAATAIVNGNYLNQGTHATLSDGVNYYLKGNLYLYRKNNGGPESTGWYISTELGSSRQDECYYAGGGANNTPVGYTLDDAGSLGLAASYPIINELSLSVELISYSTVLSHRGVEVKWTTESETDNLGFILERAVEKQCNASLLWQTIASYETHTQLHGQGSTSQRTEYTFVDNDVKPGETYIYRLSDVNTAGEINVYDDISITLEQAPDQTVLAPPFPNPFNPETKINYQLSEAGPMEIFIYDLLGRKVRTLVNEEQSAGSYNVYWHGDDVSGSKVATGTYLIVLKTVEGVRTQKVVMLR